MNEKKAYWDLDDLQDMAVKLDLMIQGYIYSVSQDTNTKKQEEQLRCFSFELQEKITDIQNCFDKDKEGE